MNDEIEIEKMKLTDPLLTSMRIVDSTYIKGKGTTYEMEIVYSEIEESALSFLKEDEMALFIEMMGERVESFTSVEMFDGEVRKMKIRNRTYFFEHAIVDFVEEEKMRRIIGKVQRKIKKKMAIFLDKELPIVKIEGRG